MGQYGQQDRRVKKEIESRPFKKGYSHGFYIANGTMSTNISSMTSKQPRSYAITSFPSQSLLPKDMADSWIN